jgi:glucan 1,3-beta-glucosidase
VDAGGNGATGSLSVIDSSCNECGNMVNGSSSFVLENIALTNSGSMLKTDGQDKLIGDLLGKTYVVGHVQTSNNGSVEDSAGAYVNPTERGKLVDGDGHYFTKSQPQYTGWDVSSFSSVKDCGAKGVFFHNYHFCIA